MGQCQLMLENNEKDNKKILYLSDLKIRGLKGCSFVKGKSLVIHIR
jgi:hypothetical protein